MWGDRETALGAGFDPDVVLASSARRRLAEAAAGRPVVVPLYWRIVPGGTLPPAPGLRSDGSGPSRGAFARPEQGLRVQCRPAGMSGQSFVDHPLQLGEASRFWSSVHDALEAHVGPREVVSDGWERVGVPMTSGSGARADGPPGVVQLVARSSDWDLLAAWLSRRYASRGIQDAPEPTASSPQILARHLARIEEGDDWGYLYLEVCSRQLSGRLAPTRSLLWRASWSGVYRFGDSSANTVMQLGQHRFPVDGRSFRVRALAQWDRPDAVRALRLPAAGAFAWTDASLDAVRSFFADRPPQPDESGPHDS